MEQFTITSRSAYLSRGVYSLQDALGERQRRVSSCSYERMESARRAGEVVGGQQADTAECMNVFEFTCGGGLFILLVSCFLAPALNTRVHGFHTFSDPSSHVNNVNPTRPPYNRPLDPLRACHVHEGARSCRPTFFFNKHRDKTMATPTTAGRVIIGQGITVKGDIKNCEEVIVRGFFDAGNVEAKTVVVESDGVLTGATKAQNAKIAGKFDGHLRLSEGLNVTSSGEAKGTIRYRGIQVENGGKLFGDIQFATEEEA